MDLIITYGFRLETEGGVLQESSRNFLTDTRIAWTRHKVVGSVRRWQAGEGEKKESSTKWVSTGIQIT